MNTNRTEIGVLRKGLVPAATLLSALLGFAQGGPHIVVVFKSPEDVPVTAAEFAADGLTFELDLRFAPAVGTALTVVNNTGPDPIHGRFTNLPDGQQFNATCNGLTFVLQTSYSGGDGNDLVLTTIVSPSLCWKPLLDPGNGGRITGLAVSPHDPSRIIASGDILGLAFSSNGGNTWRSTLGIQGCYEFESISFHPTDPSAVWIGSVLGPWKSEDGGQSWTLKRTGFPPTVWATYVAPVQKVLFDPVNPQRLLAFTGARRGRTAANPSTRLGEVYESLNGGESWALLQTISSGFHILHAAWGNAAGSVLYAATSDGFFRSTDSGANWAKVTSGLPAGQIGWVAVNNADGNTLWVTAPDDGIFKSTNGGLSFSPSNGGTLPTGTAQNWRVVESASNDPSVVYAANFTGTQGIWRSPDGGQSWTKASFTNGSPFPIYGDVDCLAISPFVENQVFGGTATTIWRTADGLSWSDVTSTSLGNNAWRGTGLSGQCPNDFKWNPHAPNEAMMCAWDAGKFLSRDNFASWKFGGGGRGLGLPDWGGIMDVAFTRVTGEGNGVIYLVQSQAGDNRIYRTNSGGNSWTRCTDPTTSGNYLSIYAHPTETNRVWVVRNSAIYASTDSGSSWTQAGAEAGSVRVLTGRPDGSELFAGGAGVFRSSDGATFASLGFPRNGVTRIRLDPVSSGRLYVVNRSDSNSAYRGLHRYDSGTWTTLLRDGTSTTAKLLADVAIDPARNDRIVVCSNEDPYTVPTRESGVWISESGGPFLQHNSGLPLLRISCLAFKPDGSGTIVAGAGGRGYFIASTAGLNIDSPPVVPSGASSSVRNGSATLSWSQTGGATSYKIERSSDGSTGWTQIAWLGAETNSFTDTAAPTGLYHYRVRASNAAGDSGYSVTQPMLAGAPAPIQLWRWENGLPWDGSGSGADEHIASADGLPNLLKYALGLAPTEAAPASALPSGRRDGSAFEFRFTRMRDATDITYRVEHRPNLASGAWTEVWNSDSSPYSGIAPSITETCSFPLGGRTGFYRLKITHP